MSISPLQKNLTAPTRRPPTDEEELDWRALMMAARERLWLIIVLPVLCGVLGYAYLKKTVAVYQSTSSLEVEDKQQVMKFEGVTSDELRDAATMNTVAATVTSRTFLHEVEKKEGFASRPDFFVGEAPPEATDGEAVVDVLATSLEGVVRPNTRIIDITAKHPNPEIARDMANAASEGIIRFGLKQKTQVAGLASDYLVQEEKRLRDQLEKSELALQKYRNDNNAVSLEKDQNVVVAELNNTRSKLSEATSERLQKETDFNSLRQAGDKAEEALRLHSVSTNPAIMSITQGITDRKTEIAVIQNRYKPKHPKYVALQTALDDLKKQLAQTLPDVVAQLESEVENTRTIETKAREALAAQEKKALELDTLAVSYNVLKREVESNKSLYESILGRMKEIQVTSGLENNHLKIHEEARISASPVWPTPLKVYSASVGGGLALAFGLALLLHFMDRSIKTVSDAEKTLNLPVLAAVSLGNRQEGALNAWKEPNGTIAESFRSLRAMASLLGREEDRRTFLITSAVPSEGKTFCASNYAISLAQQGLKTLLIDADLRKPRVSTVFFGEKRKPGLNEYLIGKSELEAASHPTTVEHLMVMPAGDRSPNPAELLSGPGVKRLLADALRTYDRIVIDSAPVLAVSDSLLIAPHVETVFQVIQWKKTPAPVVQRAIGMLRDAGRTPAGLILNQLPHKSKSYYYYYSPGYYGSEGVYGAKA